MYINRKAYSKLFDWKNISNGSTSILINGARRVGKTYLAREFAKNEYKTCIEINFSKVNNDIKDLFNNSLMDLDYLFNSLSIIFNTPLYDRESVIILDDLYNSLVCDKLNVNEGMLMENVVSQILRSNGHKLFYYSRNDNIKRENDIKIDFLINRNDEICPIEVKSSKYNKHSSLDKYMTKFKGRYGQPYIL